MTSAASIFADDLYERLAVAPSATTEEIKHAYRRLLRQYPPERAPEEFKRIREAYETLTDPQARHEYDTQPDPAVRRLLEEALAAMGKENYRAAERLLKQVLIQQPDLAFARNHLGLCFLYQERPAEAAEQFERLMRTEHHAAYIFGNAAHAYQMAGRLSDAERAFGYAINLGDEDSVGYYVGLASVYVDQRRFNEAKKLLEDAIRADGRIDFEDLQYFTKLLEVHILDRDLEGTESVLERVERIVSDDDEARYVAWKLGQFGQDLVRMMGFRYAALFAATAERLQKHDGDYAALRRMAEALDSDDIDQVLGLVRHHPSFQPSGWLSQLRPVVEEHCQRRRVFGEMTPIKRAPGLGTINGIGTRLYGRRDHDPHTDSHITTLYFTFLFIPLFPIACYRVMQRSETSWSFIGKVPFGDAQKRHLAAFVVGVILLLVWAGAGSGGTGTSYRPPSSSPRTPAPSTYQPSTGAAQRSSQPSRSWVQAEQERIRGMERRLRSIESEMTSTESELESLRSRIDRMEGNARAGVWYDEAEYDRLINRHNLSVEEYNAFLASYNNLYSEYSAAVDAYNLRLQRR